MVAAKGRGVGEGDEADCYYVENHISGSFCLLGVRELKTQEGEMKIFGERETGMYRLSGRRGWLLGVLVVGWEGDEEGWGRSMVWVFVGLVVVSRRHLEIALQFEVSSACLGL